MKYLKNKHTLSLVVHKDGATTRLILYGAYRVRLCSVTLGYYYEKMRPVSASIALYKSREHAVVRSIYKDDKESKSKQNIAIDDL